MKRSFFGRKKRTTRLRAAISRFASPSMKSLSKKGLKRIGFSVAGKSQISLNWNGKRTLVSVGKKPGQISHAFVLAGKPKRLVLVDKSFLGTGKMGQAVRISGYSMLPADFAAGKRNQLIYSLTYVKPEKGIAFFDNLVWAQQSPAGHIVSGASEPAAHIRGKGLASFIGSCVKEECFGRGVEKIFGLVENRDFGKITGFREASAAEKKLAVDSFPTVKEFFRSKDPVGKLMVLDSKP